jgi:hypothetical protein
MQQQSRIALVWPSEVELLWSILQLAKRARWPEVPELNVEGDLPEPKSCQNQSNFGQNCTQWAQNASEQSEHSRVQVQQLRRMPYAGVVV